MNVAATPEIQLIKEMARYHQDPPEISGQSLVPLAAGGSGTPLFCIHGLGGHVASFLPLADGLAHQRPVYALQAQGLDAGTQPQHSFQAMAKSYLDEIRELQPTGPYLLAGWSLGGLIALEAAGQLKSTGQQVDLLAMMDTRLRASDPEPLELDDQSVVRWLAPHLGISLTELKQIPLDQRWDRIAQQAKLATGIGAVEIRRLAEVCKAQLTAAARYEPQPFDGPAVLLRAGTARRRLDKRWPSFCPQLQVEKVAGDHYSMLRPPHVDELVERLSCYLPQESISES